MPATPILSGPNREPLWPTGVVGSITHCPDYCAAVVALRTQITTVGIDAELHAPLPRGVLNIVATKEEQQSLSALPSIDTCWDRVLFSAKESVYKAWFQIAGSWLGFDDAIVRIDPQRRRFTADLVVATPAIFGRSMTEFEGRFLISDGLILTAVSIGV